MLKQSVDRVVSCCSLKGKQLLFSDERVKWHLLHQLEEVQTMEGWEIYAFCLTDDEAYFITEAADVDAVQAALRRAAEQVLEQLGRAIYGRYYTGDCFWETGPVKLNSLQEIAECCRSIHRLPVEKGYVSRMADYWWSSYNTYLGAYEWKFTNPHILLLYFSADYEEAVSQFRYYHRISTKYEDDFLLKITEKV